MLADPAVGKHPAQTGAGRRRYGAAGGMPVWSERCLRRAFQLYTVPEQRPDLVAGYALVARAGHMDLAPLGTTGAPNRYIVSPGQPMVLNPILRAREFSSAMRSPARSGSAGVATKGAPTRYASQFGLDKSLGNVRYHIVTAVDLESGRLRAAAVPAGQTKGTDAGGGLP